MKNHPRNCEVCGKIFVPRAHFIVCCSPECSIKRKYRIARERSREYAKKRREIAAEKNADNEKNGSFERVCLSCGKTYQWHKGLSGKRCPECSKIERQKAYQRRKDDFSEPKPTHLCADCKQVFTWNHRCPECLAKWRAKNGVRQEAYYREHEEDLYHAFL